MNTFFRSEGGDFVLMHGDCMRLMREFDFRFDTIFADPPYFLSSGGITCQNGKVACVDKGEWDKSQSAESINSFNKEWLSLCRDKLKDNGTIWVSGTYHNIFTIAFNLTSLGYKILNVITWVKTNPPPNIACRTFTHSTEFIVWARKSASIPHYYNYKLMRVLNANRQMTDVWHLPAIARWEKTCGKHPTQKPLSLLVRILLASTQPGAWVLDPFAGSSTTGIAANLLERKFLGIEKELPYLDISRSRRLEMDRCREAFRLKIKDLQKLSDRSRFD